MMFSDRKLLTLLSKLNEEYCILGIRKLANRGIYKWVICRHHT